MKTKKYTKLLILDIEESVKDWLRKKAKEEKKSMASLVREALLNYWNKQ